MKFHWGHGIALAYTCFALALITAVVKSTDFDNSLVTKDYYAEDIAYQATMNSKRNSQLLENPLTLNRVANEYELVFPIQELNGKVKGEIWLYSPVSSKEDQKLPVQLNASGEQRLKFSNTRPGRYKMIISWTDGKRKYLDQFRLNLTV